MSTVVRSIEVDVPVSTAFEEWTRFEELPRFVRGLVEVRRLDDRNLYWRAQIAAVETVWQLEITALDADERIAWASCSGPRNWGVLRFEPLPTSGTRMTMEVHYDPASFMQNITDYFGVLGRWVEGSLLRFKDMMESPYTRLSQLPRAEDLVGQ
jgi:uncharacterized membrane protein